MDSSMLVGNTVADQVAELAKGNPCLVPGTRSEYYDCCTEGGQKLCLGMGITNAVLLGQLAIAFAILIWKSRWFNAQWLLKLTVGFQSLTLLCKASICANKSRAGHVLVFRWPRRRCDELIRRSPGGRPG